MFDTGDEFRQTPLQIDVERLQQTTQMLHQAFFALVLLEDGAQRTRAPIERVSQREVDSMMV